jgi:hypothetical protein
MSDKSVVERAIVVAEKYIAGGEIFYFNDPSQGVPVGRRVEDMVHKIADAGLLADPLLVRAGEAAKLYAKWQGSLAPLFDPPKTVYDIGRELLARKEQERNKWRVCERRDNKARLIGWLVIFELTEHGPFTEAQAHAVAAALNALDARGAE